MMNFALMTRDYVSNTRNVALNLMNVEGRQAVVRAARVYAGERHPAGAAAENPVSFLLKNPDFLLKNPDFLLKNPDFIILQPVHGDPLRAEVGLVSKNDELCIRNEELCIKNEDLCIKNEEFVLKMMNFTATSRRCSETCRRRWLRSCCSTCTTRSSARCRCSRTWCDFNGRILLSY